MFKDKKYLLVCWCDIGILQKIKVYLRFFNIELHQNCMIMCEEGRPKRHQNGFTKFYNVSTRMPLDPFYEFCLLTKPSDL